MDDARFLLWTDLVSEGSSEGAYFGSIGYSLGVYGGGYGGGEVYAYQSLGFGFGLIDLTAGYASDVEDYMGGIGVSADGVPAAALSFDEIRNFRPEAPLVEQLPEVGTCGGPS